ncbi:MAG: hypothetical protein UT30_C0002G0043 [Candidatus Uhrbacteria bacterium GW2011_GWF2_39_13]|uniref:Transglutaminase-like domain-containing protein n=1 Tax=Candidatus Uhrbacteria bacterium GW2011_GWF2_39_13 TaxID=1618995 RepID=A0A0G0MWV4_9BACT|nr:MAG: hypothetical protein UT30_C0002G0043 [Candidatus Uhrbacteria bacterium GW2011_GWF2_39_13]HAU66131.1 hypothetical protein [Candidatus Uhrbacteria bacterium]
MRYLSLLVIFLLITGAGCTNLRQKTTNEPTETFEEQEQEVLEQGEEELEVNDEQIETSDFDLVSSESTILKQLQTTGRGSQLKNGLNTILSNRSVLLLGGECQVETYTDLAQTVYRQKEIGSYSIIIASFEEDVLSESDSCIKMLFPLTDIESLKSMLALLQSDFQDQLEETEVSLTIQQDLPGTCEEVAAYVAKKFPKSAERAYERCTSIREQEEEQGGEADEDLQNEGNNVACTIVPDSQCSPNMSSEDYVLYAQKFFTPTDSTVIEEASRYSGIEDMYKAMQLRYWVADTEIYGCSDKFALPKDYLAQSPEFTSSPVCEKQSAVGDCDDQASASGSLYEAAAFFGKDNVRTALGMVQFGNSPLDIGGHAWTEVYYEGQWFPVDAVFGNTCYENGRCYSYSESELIDWDYFRYVEYPVIEYWGWSNDKYYYLPATAESSSGLPAYWKEKASTIYGR